MNKILIVDPNKEIHQQFERILEGVLREGGELFFATHTEGGLAILKKEHPRLVFLDITLLGSNEDLWVQENSHIILMQHHEEARQVSEDVLYKPLDAAHVLEKCRGVLEAFPTPQAPPM